MKNNDEVQVGTEKKKKEEKSAFVPVDVSSLESLEDLTSDIIKSLNKGLENKIAFNLKDSPEVVGIKHWIPTGCEQLDLILSNKYNGGWPSGRMVEVFGAKSCGKSHLSVAAMANVQKQGGIAILFDAERAPFDIEYYKSLGLRIDKTFIYIRENVIENIMSQCEKIIDKIASVKKDIPVVVVIDSFAACIAKADVGDGDPDEIYDSKGKTKATGASAWTRGLKLITSKIADHNILFMILNQVRKNMNMTFADKYKPSEKSAASVAHFDHAMSARVYLSTGSDGDKVSKSRQEIESENGMDITRSVRVTAEVVKNKIGPAYRKIDYRMKFGEGVSEDEEVLTTLRRAGSARDSELNLDYAITKSGGWYNFDVSSSETGEVLLEKKFQAAQFQKLRNSDEEFDKYAHRFLATVMIKDFAAEKNENYSEEE